MNIKDIFRDEVSKVSPEIQKQVDLSFAIADKIASVLEERKMTQKQLSKLVGCTEADVCRWLGGTHNFTIRTIARISTALEVDLINVSE